jgi:exodeoxyribonuclease-1
VALVFYDVETTGLNKRFDQILQFAAVRTDVDLIEIGRLETRSRLMPHIVPSPKALHLTGTSLAKITDPSRPTHYSMVCEIAQTLTSWSPSVFLGFNSISFDEEFLRQAFYQCLHPVFLTNTPQNTRGDVLNLMRAAGTLHPSIIRPGIVNGADVYQLGPLAAANGIALGRAHDATCDVEAMLELCRLVRAGAPELWSTFLRFSSKANVVDFVAAEEAFAYFNFYGSPRVMHFLTKVGISRRDANTHYCCLDLGGDIELLRKLDGSALVERINVEPRPIRRLRVNRSPLLYPLWDIEESLFGETSEEELLRSASSVKADPEFMGRLVDAADSAATVYPASEHVELQIYGGNFFSDSDRELCAAFHSAKWEDRLRLLDQMDDPRLRRLGRRLVYFEAPHLLEDRQRLAAGEDIAARRRGDSQYASPPWTTISVALSELASINTEVSEEFRRDFNSIS